VGRAGCYQFTPIPDLTTGPGIDLAMTPAQLYRYLVEAIGPKPFMQVIVALRYSDERGLTIRRVAYRIGRTAVRYGRELTRGQALRRFSRGGDVATDGARAMRKLSKDSSRLRGGPGKCVVEPGPTGMPHGHASANEPGTKRFPGHVFFDPNLTLPWYLRVLDDNDDGAIDEWDVLEAINPFPIPIRPTAPETI